MPENDSKYAEKTVVSLIAKAVHDYRMIQSGDRILIGASGGKDSTTLVYDFALRQKYSGIPFEFQALNIVTEFTSSGSIERMNDLFSAWGAPFSTINVSITGRLKPGKKMNCYWCSTQRRTELITYAVKHGFNKIALGHHLDDIIETFFMNLLRRKEISTMPPVMPYRRYPVTIIRPLALAEERQITAFAEEKDFFRFACTCRFDEKSERKAVRRKIEELIGGRGQAKRNIFEAMKNVRSDYLP